MKGIPDKSIDLILADPPYGVTNSCKWDIVIPLEDMWFQLKRIIKDNGVIALTASGNFHYMLVNSNLDSFKYEWVWEKTQATGHLNSKKRPLNAHEFISIYYDKQPIYNPQMTSGHKPVHNYTKYLSTVNKSDVYGKTNVEISGGGNTNRFPRSVILFPSDKQTNYLHPTQKPLALMEYLVKTYTNKNDCVLDFCMGSGTTGVACVNTNRNFIGIELDKKYFDIAKERIESA